MRNVRFRRLPHRLIVLVLVLLASACTGPSADTTPTSSPTTASPAPTPTATTAIPLTAHERAWLQAIATLHRRFDKEFRSEGTVTITPSKLRSWETLMRSCRTELARIGTPTARLQPVHKLVQQACQQYDKGAACFAEARRYLNSYSTSEQNKAERALECGTNAEGDGSNLLTVAEATGRDIDPAPD